MILIIEDEKPLAHEIKEVLSRLGGFDSRIVNSLSEAKLLNIDNFNFVLLDWMLPDGQGIDFLKDLRKRGVSVPVIMLTARSDITDKVLGLEIGASDYLCKPFDSRELIARIRSRMVSLPTKQFNQKIQIEPFEMNLSSREVLYKHSKLELSKMEFALLEFFLKAPDTAFSREELLNKVWGFDRFPTTRTVDAHVMSLRQKTHSSHFQTVRGIGYKFTINLQKVEE